MIHSIIFESSKFTSTSARKWLKDHKYTPIKRVDKTTNYLRYRIRDPSLFKSFITKEISPGIKFVIGTALIK